MHERRLSSILSFMISWSLFLIPVAMSAQTATIQFADDAGQPADSFQEFQPVQVRATDAARAGQWSIPARVTSDLRGDEELINLTEQGSSTGIFVGWVLVRGTLSSDPPTANDSFLEVTEIAGPPLLRDTIRAELIDCSAAPCPSDTAAMTGTGLRIIDDQWADIGLIAPPATIQLEARDRSVTYYLPITATVTSGGDAETVTLDPAWQDPSTPQFGRFRGGIAVEVGAPIPGDGVLQVAATDVVTASRPDPLGLSSAIDSATVGSALLSFLDRAGQPVDYVLMSGDVRVRAFFPAGNLSSSGADSVSVEVLSRDSLGNVRDRETLTLVETGIDTSLFVGQMPSEPSGSITFDDGVLETGAPYGTLDTIEATLDAATATATLRGGILRFVDAAGADLTQVPANETVYLRLEADFQNWSSTDANLAWVRVMSLSTGDWETFPLFETGFDTAVFTGSITGRIGVAALSDGLLQTQPGETIRGESYQAYQLAFDEAVVGEGPTNSPPDAVDDSAVTPDGTAVAIDVTANDSDPEGQTLTVASFTQGAHGTVSDGGGGLLTYTPATGFSGTDTFTYRLVDGQGGEDTATVTVTVEFVNDPPVVYADYVTTDEDTALSINPIANDSDPEGHALTLDFVFPSNLGTAVITNAAAGTLLYTPNLNANGTDTVVYRVRDAQGATSMGFIDVTMLPVNDPPVAVNDTATTAEDTLVSVFPLANDSDPDGETIWISAPWPVAAHGQVGASATMFNYLPAANYNGTDTVTYTINDGHGQTATATVTITITPVPDPPVAVTDNVTTAEDTVLVVSPLANDSDPDGDTFSLLSVTTAFHGSLVINGNGTVTYTPVANYNGTDRFDYTIQDSTGRTATARVNLTLTAVNDPPDAVNDSVSVNEDSSVTVFVKSNDTDPDGDLLSVQSVTQGAHGTVTMSNGLPFYTPVANYFGPDSFTYTLSDLHGGTDVATVSVTVNNVQDAPSASPDAATTPEDTPIDVSVLANDSDADGNTLVVYAVTAAAHGTVTFTAANVHYVPNANYFGPDAFTYSVNDGTGRSATGVPVSITVTPVNDVPTAGNDFGSVAEDGSVTLSVLGNDADPDGEAFAIVSTTQGANGGAVSFTASTVTYTPAANFRGMDFFTYAIGDGNGGSATATVTITITSVNDAPVAGNNAGTVVEDGSISISVLGNDSDIDGDALAIVSTTQGANGAVGFTASTVTYTPAANYNGADSFTYTIGDGNGGSATAAVSVTVTAVNDSPNAGTDAGTVAEDGTASLSVLANDSDIDGDTLAVTAVTQGAHGSVSSTAGSVTYTPAANYNGADSFTYTIGDGNGGSATATVSVTVTAVNDSPNAGNDAVTVAEDGTASLSVLGNDSDGDGDSLAVTAVTQGAHGSVSLTAAWVTYTPAANYNGADSFTYTIGDGNGGSATATVSVTVTAVNDSPNAGNDAATVAEDGTVSLSVLGNDSDVDGDTLTVTAVTQAAHGSVSFTSGGVTYTPVANYNGADSFTYTIRDTAGLISSASVSVSITAVNDPPDAINDAATTIEAGSGVVVTVLANDTDIDGNALVVTTVSTPAHGTATRNANNTVTYVPVASYSGADSFTYTINDGAATDTATVAIQVMDVIGRVAVLGTHSVQILTGADVLSGDVVVNQAGTAPFLGATEVSLGGGVTTPSGWDLQGNRVTIAANAAIASDVYSNQLTNNGTVTGALYSPLALPIFATLPALLASTPGASDVNVGVNGTQTLAPGSYRDLIVGKRGTVTFTGGTYHFRSINLSGSEAKLFFSAPSTIRVQQRISTSNLAQIRPGTGSTATAATIVFHVAGANGAGGGLSETPKAVEIGIDGTVTANLYAPNGTIWLKDSTLATGAFLGKDVQIGQNVQVTLGSAW